MVTTGPFYMKIYKSSRYDHDKHTIIKVIIANKGKRRIETDSTYGMDWDECIVQS